MQNPNEMFEMMYSCIALHNYIRITDETADYDLEVGLEVEVDDEEHANNDDEGTVTYQQACNFRNMRALNMWNDYIASLQAFIN